METQNEYYNAKPSNIKNLGKDVSGAKRMNFDTYESPEQRETRKRKNANDKKLKEALKAAILADSPDRHEIADLIAQKFKAEYGFDCRDESARSIIMEKRKLITNDAESRKSFSELVNRYNSTMKDLRITLSEYYFRRYLDRMTKKYAPKDSFVGQSGARFDWKEFSSGGEVDIHLLYLKDHTSAVQFGNSVSDKERGYIVKELSRFLQEWQLGFTANADIRSINWSFGARGNGQSGAFYDNSRKVISVNRNNIGSLVHEIGHYLDFKSNRISNRISDATVQAYAKTLPECMQGAERRYYCSRVEIFARAFEAYCYHVGAKFSVFAHCGKAYLPELNEELIALVKQVLN